MTIIQALILGIIQGLTELLPVSSSAHLAIFPWIFKWSEIPESFDIALHFGTLLAISLFFIKDWIGLIKGGFNQVVKKEKSTEGKIFWYIVIATIPTGILSLILDQLSDQIFPQGSNSYIIAIAVALIVMGIILYIVDKKSKATTDYENLSFTQAILIGISQAIAAAFPGVSRSGITMTVARSLKVDRESAAKYSFLLSTPVILAAVIFSLDAFEFSFAFLVGVLASFVVGIVVIKFLLEYLKKGSFKIFAIYRVIFGMIILALVFLR